MIQHAGNALNQMTFEEHDGNLNAKRVSLASSATIFAVVNTGAAGIATSVLGAGDRFIGLVTNVPAGNTTLNASSAYIGLATVNIGANPNTYIGLVTVGGIGTLTLADPKGYIGLVTIGGIGTITLADPKNYIGLTTTTLGVGDRFIGLTTVVHAGNVSLNASAAYIGLASVNIGGTLPALSAGVANIGFATVANATAWPDPKGYIGLVTITGSLSAAAGNVTLDPGSITQIRDGADSVMKLSIASVADGTYAAVRLRGNSTVIVGNIPAVTNNAGAAYIGLATVDIGTIKAWGDPHTYLGLVTVDIGASKGITWAGNVTLSDAKTYIGLTTTTLGLGDRFIGLVTTAFSGNVSLNASAAYIGLVTAIIGNASVATKNAGTTKTLKILPVAFATSSAATIVVPTNTFYITSILLNSNATVRLNVRSGATYLTGNASLGINIFPGGGWVETGSVDSPVYQGLAAAAPIVIEKFDTGGIISQIGGKVVYFDE